MPDGQKIDKLTDVFVVDHGPRSLSVLPFPLEVSKASLAQWKAIPGVGAKRAARIKRAKTIESAEQLANLLELELPSWLTRSLSFTGD
jgi:radical SAM superfamily enzyme with C-terminal helix-hairpin-helix motif